MLFETALQGSVPAMIFYLKARAGWTGEPKGPLEDLPQPQLKIYCPDVNGTMVERDLFDVQMRWGKISKRLGKEGHTMCWCGFGGKLIYNITHRTITICIGSVTKLSSPIVAPALYS